MRNLSSLARFLALWLTLGLSLPSPALALRTLEPVESGLEEDIADALRGNGADSRSPDYVYRELEFSNMAGTALQSGSPGWAPNARTGDVFLLEWVPAPGEIRQYLVRVNGRSLEVLGPSDYMVIGEKKAGYPQKVRPIRPDAWIKPTVPEARIVTIPGTGVALTRPRLLRRNSLRIDWNRPGLVTLSRMDPGPVVVSAQPATVAGGLEEIGERITAQTRILTNGVFVHGSATQPFGVYLAVADNGATVEVAELSLTDGRAGPSRGQLIRSEIQGKQDWRYIQSWDVPAIMRELSARDGAANLALTDWPQQVLLRLELAGGLEEGMASREVSMRYSMHILPADLFVEQMDSLYRLLGRMNVEPAISFRNQRNNTETSQPKRRADILALGLREKDGVTISVQGNLSQGIKEELAGAIAYLLNEVRDAEIGAGFDQQNTASARQELDARFGGRLGKLEKLIRSEQNRAAPNQERGPPFTAAGLEEDPLREMTRRYLDGTRREIRDSLQDPVTMDAERLRLAIAIVKAGNHDLFSAQRAYRGMVSREIPRDARIQEIIRPSEDRKMNRAFYWAFVSELVWGKYLSKEISLEEFVRRLRDYHHAGFKSFPLDAELEILRLGENGQFREPPVASADDGRALEKGLRNLMEDIREELLPSAVPPKDEPWLRSQWERWAKTELSTYGVRLGRAEVLVPGGTTMILYLADRTPGSPKDRVGFFYVGKPKAPAITVGYFTGDVVQWKPAVFVGVGGDDLIRNMPMLVTGLVPIEDMSDGDTRLRSMEQNFLADLENHVSAPSGRASDAPDQNQSDRTAGRVLGQLWTVGNSEASGLAKNTAVGIGYLPPLAGDIETPPAGGLEEGSLPRDVQQAADGVIRAWNGYMVYIPGLQVTPADLAGWLNILKQPTGYPSEVRREAALSTRNDNFASQMVGLADAIVQTEPTDLAKRSSLIDSIVAYLNRSLQQASAGGLEEASPERWAEQVVSNLLVSYRELIKEQLRPTGRKVEVERRTGQLKAQLNQRRLPPQDWLALTEKVLKLSQSLPNNPDLLASAFFTVADLNETLLEQERESSQRVDDAIMDRMKAILVALRGAYQKLSSPAGLEEGIRVETAAELAARARTRDGQAVSAPGWATHALLVPDRLLRQAAQEQPGVLHVYAQESVSLAAVSVLPRPLELIRMHDLPEDPAQLEEALRKMEPEGRAVIVLDAKLQDRVRRGEILPKGHDLALLVDPVQWEGYTNYQNELAALLATPPERLQNWVVLLTAGTVVKVRIDGEDFTAIFA